MTDTIEIYGDGGSRGNPGPAASAFVVLENGKKVYEESKYLGETTNNVAEYNCVIIALEWLSKNSKTFEKVFFRLDSELVTKQILGVYKIRSPHLIPLNKKVKGLVGQIKCEIVFISVPREKNETADALVNEELDKNVS